MRENTLKMKRNELAYKHSIEPHSLISLALSSLCISYHNRTKQVCGIFNLLNCPFWMAQCKGSARPMFVYLFVSCFFLLSSICSTRAKIYFKEKAELIQLINNGINLLALFMYSVVYRLLAWLPKVWLRYRSIWFSTSSSLPFGWIEQFGAAI